MNPGDQVEVGFNPAQPGQAARNPLGTYATAPEYGVIVKLYSERDERFYGFPSSYLVRVKTEGRTDGRLRILPETKLKVL